MHLTPFADTKVMILGQDPYHGAGPGPRSVLLGPPGVAKPPSLVNICKELQSDLGIELPTHGSLEAWARQGVLLLNTTLTVRAGQAASHQGKGWEVFTDEVLAAVNAKPERVVFILWGASARRKKSLIDTQPPRRDRVRAPVAAVGPQRLLRLEAVQPGQRRARSPPAANPIDWRL